MNGKAQKPEPVKSPGDFIREELRIRGWTQADLAKITDRPLPTINRILQGKHALLPEMAIALGIAFGNGAEVWMSREAAYRLSLASAPDDEGVRRRARLFEIAPIKEMQRRGWIKTTDDVNKLEAEILQFLEINSLDEQPQIQVATKRSGIEADLSPQQIAWCCRVRHLASKLKVSAFDKTRLKECAASMRVLAAYPLEARKLANLLAEHGIRFIVVEPLQSSKIDGVATWLGPDQPVIGVSVRFDRIDAFWFCVMHEFAHIVHGDALSVDSDLAGEDKVPSSMKCDIERRADDFAVQALVPQDALDSFVARVGPLYSKQRINQFAHRIKVHPGIIVGQLQYRGEIGYHANREMLMKVREAVAGSSVTDGWGHTISL